MIERRRSSDPGSHALKDNARITFEEGRVLAQPVFHRSKTLMSRKTSRKTIL